MVLGRNVNSSGGKQGVRPADVLKTLAVVVVVIVDYGCVGSFPLGDVREQSGSRGTQSTYETLSELTVQYNKTLFKDHNLLCWEGIVG